MPGRKSKSKKLKQLEEKLRILKREIAKRKQQNKQSNTVTSSPSKSKRSKRSKSISEECQALLDRMKKLAYCKGFLTPVDWRSLNIPNYPHIIKRPMDMSTVERNLQNGVYHTPYDFARDMRLIYQNACTFNKPGTTYFNAALKFAKKFEEEFERKIIDQFETNEFTKKIIKAIVQIIKRDDSAPFRMPVAVEVLDLKDYYDVIKRPMDLGTILNQIHKYRDFRKFLEDLYLVWDNCTHYNPQTLAIHQTAVRLREYTQKQLSKYCTSDFQSWQANEELHINSPSTLTMSTGDEQSVMSEQTNSRTVLAPGPMDVNLPSDSDHNTINHAMDSQSQSQFGDHMDIDMNDSTQPPTSAPSQDVIAQQPDEIAEERDIFKMCDEVALRDEDEANRLMIGHLLKVQELNPDSVNSLNFQQKEELQRGIQCLDSDHFDPLINMLQSFIPEGEGDDDEVELDVDAIDDPLQVKMYNYMLRAVRQQETERIQREGGDLNMLPDTNVNNNNNNNAMEIDHASQQQQTHVTLMEPEPQHQVMHEQEEHHHQDTEEEQQQQQQQQQQSLLGQEGSDDVEMSGVSVFQSHAQQEVHDQHEEQGVDDNEQQQQVTEIQPTEFPFGGQQEQSPAVAQHDTAANYTFQPNITSEHAENTNQAEVHVAMEDDHDIQMMNKPEQHHEAESNVIPQDNDGEDIVADIANAIDVPTSMTPVDNTESALQPNDAVQDAEQPPQEEPQQAAQEENVNVDENNATPQPAEETQETHVIPTMPALQPDDEATSNNAQEENQEADKEAEEGNQTTTNIETQQSEHDEKMELEQNKDENDENLMDEANEAMNDDMEEEDDIDTPLAADIDF